MSWYRKGVESIDDSTAERQRDDQRSRARRNARQEAQQAAARIDRLELRLDSRIDAVKQGIEGTMLPVRDMEYWIGLFSARNSAGNLTVPPLRPPR